MVVIIGGGICGLGIGWRLAQAGLPVMILERDRAGQGATWAAAGMLAAQAEAEPGEEPLTALLLASQRLWPDFARELEQASGQTVDYRDEGTLVVAQDRDEAERLRRRYDYGRRYGLALEWLSGAEARRREPHLARGVTAALFSASDHQVDNRKVALALHAAFLRAGGVLREHTSAREIVLRGGRVAGVRLPDDEIAADTIVLAAGCWSRQLAGLPPEAQPPVRPVKGQMLALQMLPDAPLIHHVVWGRDAYLVPRRDGRLLIGATVEEQGFDTSLSGGGLRHLLQGAWQVLPAIDELPLVEAWAGLRPGSRDDAPILGPTSLPGLVLATGHYRNGILLAPLTAWAISRLILDGVLPPVAQPFTMARFARSHAKEEAPL
ncbi:glycine oxidase ThiO [Kallotenue papyrolyticum]|uniref:glycine oxidase ThiO n=1 Tax=Kallotenue papyrolyticum TaxID=1325125 RepID=UPI0004AE40E8|nr:glycine oxidase ThiO [Kallotenue papyrolyticum]